MPRALPLCYSDAVNAVLLLSVRASHITAAASKLLYMHQQQQSSRKESLGSLAE